MALIVCGILQFIPLLVVGLLFISGVIPIFTPHFTPPPGGVAELNPKVGLVRFWLVLLSVLSSFSGALIIVGGINMKRLQAYPLAIVASIAALLFFPLSTILGIWSLVVLMRPEVREAFKK